MSDALEITAYRIEEDAGPLPPAPRRRAWMDATRNGFAYHCLPMVIANQLGWVVPCPLDFVAVWDGRRSVGGVRLYDLDALTGAGSPRWLARLLAGLFGQHGEKLGGTRSLPGRIAARALLGGRLRRFGRRFRLDSDFAVSHFGAGVVTFRLRHLFRTSGGHNLWVKGAANHFVDGAMPLEGVVEADWLPFFFTMNWRLTRPHHAVVFREGDPLCVVVPYPRDYLERFQARSVALGDEPELRERYLEWRDAREEHRGALAAQRKQGVDLPFQDDYLHGRDREGGRFEAHQTRIRLSRFEGAGREA